MSQRTARKYREEEMLLTPERPSEPSEEQRALRRKQLDRVLSHQGKIDFDLDPETLAPLRSAR
jgi:hypothetical protein